VLKRELDLQDSSEHSYLTGLARAILRRVATALGLLGLVVFIVCVIALAAGVTWTVVRLSPSPGAKAKPQPQDEASSS
jgi:hypothetical protein